MNWIKKLRRCLPWKQRSREVRPWGGERVRFIGPLADVLGVGRLLDGFPGLGGRLFLPPGFVSPWMPLVVEEDDDGYLVRVDVPGWDPAELAVSVSGDRLRVEGRNGEERGDRRLGRWSRRESCLRLDVPLPGEVERERASARVKRGLLTVRLPRAEKARRRRIPVRA